MIYFEVLFRDKHQLIELISGSRYEPRISRDRNVNHSSVMFGTLATEVLKH
jgi:hypothetical protein